MSDFLTPVPLADWVAQALASPDPPWLLKGIIPAQGMTFVCGRAKLAKKSWLAYAMALAMASGKAVSELKPSRKSRVLFFSREGAPGPIARRFRALEAGIGISLDEATGIFWVQNGAMFLDEPAHVKAILAFIEAERIDCVFVDTFARSFRGDENNVRDISAALRGVERIRDAGAATVLVHHLKKDSQAGVSGLPDPDSGLRGSSALAGAYDSIVSIQSLEVEGTQGMYAIIGGKYRDFEAHEYSWDIKQNEKGNPTSARLCMSEAQELPALDSPAQKVRF